LPAVTASFVCPSIDTLTLSPGLALPQTGTTASRCSTMLSENSDGGAPRIGSSSRLTSAAAVEAAEATNVHASAMRRHIRGRRSFGPLRRDRCARCG